jgi:hypothetical protein
MGMEYSDPLKFGAKQTFPLHNFCNYKGLWDGMVFFLKTEAMYANGVHMIVSMNYQNGIKFIGTDGWIWVTRGNYSYRFRPSGR